MNRLTNWLLLFLLIFSTSQFSQTFAWNRATHMVTGAIAYRELQTTSPQVAARLVTILR